MNLEQFDEKYKSLKDIDMIMMECKHEKHCKESNKVTISKGAARRNLLKSLEGKYICKSCNLKYNAPTLKTKSECRQTNEIISVMCPDERHVGDKFREMKKSSYYGKMIEPYTQVCKSCAQLDKIISEEQREKISNALSGIKKSDEFKENLSRYMKNNIDGIERGKKNLIPGYSGGWNKGLETPQEVRDKQSRAMIGKTNTEEHNLNISIGRKKMLEDTGGFTQSHKENLSKAAIRQYEKGFNPVSHHTNGWHESTKAGKVFYRSSYEKMAYIKLDANNEIKTYRVEFVTIEYDNTEKNIKGSYIIDIEAECYDNSKIWIEVKPKKFLSDTTTSIKLEEGRKAASENNIKFEVWTETELFGEEYEDKQIKLFNEKLKEDCNMEEEEFLELTRKRDREKAKKHYDNVIAKDKVEVYCEFCKETHNPLRLTYDKNIERNGRYICEREGGFIAGSKPKDALKKENPYATEGNKECTECKQVLPFSSFNKDKSRYDGYYNKCKACRNKFYKEKYHENNLKIL